jgi:lysozyme
VAQLNPDWARGIDVSNNNGVIDWTKVASSGVTFAFMKATEGATWHDPTFTSNYKAAKAAGLLVGAYCFARFGSSSPEDEADAFVKAVEAAGGFDVLPPVLDLEDDAGMAPAELADCALRWAKRVEEKTGHKPVLYISPAFARVHLTGDALADLPLWIAHYGVDSPQVPGPWHDWTFWQYTDGGQVPGIPGRVDLDVFKGTAAELRGDKTAPISSRPGSVQPPKLSLHRTLYPGASGPDVQLCQRLLYRAGFHPGQIDGAYGPATVAAVRAFQVSAHIAVDGVCGPDTWSHLEASKQADRPLTGRGDTGQQVTDLQHLLNFHGASPGAVDGVFGQHTEDAVRKFQRGRGLEVDGKVGPQTWGALLHV